jgi:predicted enzyme related to lactoylglutathione lyase
MRSRSNNKHWWGTAIEAPDPAALARFYSELLEWPVVHTEPGTAVIKPPQDGVFMVFQLAEDYVAPVLPPAGGQQRTMMHLDVQVEDLDAAAADAVALGAQVADFQPQGNVRVLLDPAGRPFCLCRDDDA